MRGARRAPSGGCLEEHRERVRDCLHRAVVRLRESGGHVGVDVELAEGRQVEQSDSQRMTRGDTGVITG